MITKNLCTCLALYDWKDEIDTVQFHELAKDFFDANGVLPTVCAVTPPDGSNRNTSYTVMAERLRSDPLPANEGLSLYHTLPKYAQLVFGWDVMASLSFAMGRMMVFCCDQASCRFSLSDFEKLLDRIARIAALPYGIGYSRTFEFGPSLYASGMLTGLGYSHEEMAERDRIAAWFHERMENNRHLTGYLRDVYPLNVISEPHLSQRIDGLLLPDWIGERPERGTLRALSGGATLWRIDEPNVERVRAELIPAGLLIAHPPTGG